MESLYLSFSVVFPIFLMLAFGFFLKRIKYVDNHFLNILNMLVFKAFLPMVLFLSIYNTDKSKAFSPLIILLAVGGITIGFGLAMLIVPLFVKDNARRGVIVQAAFRSNFLLFGLPVTISLFGIENIGITAIIAAFTVPLLNVLSVIALEVFRPNSKIDFKKILMGIVTNPLIIAAAIGAVFLWLDIVIPAPILSTVNDFSEVATPMALMVLGAGFVFKAVKKNILALIITVFVKLVGMSVVFVPIAILLGFRGVELGSLMTLFASPVAVSSFTMAEQMDGDSELAGQLVVMTSVFSIITMFIWIWVLESMSFI